MTYAPAPGELLKSFYVTIASVVLIAWPLCLIAWPLSQYRALWSLGAWRDRVPGLAFIACGLICILVLLYKTRDSLQVGILSAIALLSFVIVGVLGSSDGLSALLPNSGFCPFVRTSRERWEFVALLSTAFMAVIYGEALEDIKAGFSTTGLVGFTGIVFGLAVSVGLITGALFLLHRPDLHYLCVLAVAITFGLIDWGISNSLSSPKELEKELEEIRQGCDGGKAKELIARWEKRILDLKAIGRDSRSLLFVLDVPVILGLLVLGVGAFDLWLVCDSNVLTQEANSGATNENVLSNPCVEVYPFLAGALAFQMISFNAIYVFFSRFDFTTRWINKPKNEPLRHDSSVKNA